MNDAEIIKEWIDQGKITINEAEQALLKCNDCEHGMISFENADANEIDLFNLRNATACQAEECTIRSNQTYRELQKLGIEFN